MKNSITISVDFFFKGEKLSPSMEIDLDDHIRHQKSTASFPPLLATSNGLDHYSYEYEMLQAEPLVYSNPRGLAKAFLNDGYFDFEGFEQAWQEERIAETVAEIAREHLDVTELSSQPELQAALIEAFKLGQQS